MLSYLHGYHAGNHADVLKHTVLTALLARLVAKDKPLRYIDTHAGAGGYDLRAAAAQQQPRVRRRRRQALGGRAMRRRPWRAGSRSRSASTAPER